MDTAVVERKSEAPPMATPRAVHAHRVRHILGTLLFGTLVCAGLLVARYLCVGKTRFDYLFWNLFLAWIPLGLALWIRRMPGQRRMAFWTAVVLWVLFFPNSFYIVTDLMHAKTFGMDGAYLWFDILLAMSYVCGGIFLGCLSLYLMQLFVRERFGWRVGWLFSGAMLVLGSFGIYLGRFLRLNSWDAIVRPWKLMGHVSSLLDAASAKEVAAFTVAFFFFSLAIYCFVVSIARLHEEE
jgi:uncharacterized membrane protein